MAEQSSWVPLPSGSPPLHPFPVKSLALSASSRGSGGEDSACNEGDLGSIPGLGRSPGEKKWQPTPVFLPGESHGPRSLVGYSSWGHQESDTTERLALKCLLGQFISKC